ncbi:protein MAK10 [Trichinella spiralis]|uniref:protein MAK10 n=1 Tax=Trichinella spiralis TaxID=6334 RepID=UPI0001EFEAD4|nr:protein MAK10 [Trichinella spiralis]
MPHEELIKVFDAIFVTMVSWMINYHVMDGIFRNLYLHHPGNIEYTYLSAYCNLALKCISLIISILRRGGVCDEQDFHYLPLPSDIITGNLHLAAHSDSKQHPSPAAELAVREILLCSHILVIFFEFLIFSQTNYLKFDRAFLFCCSSTTYCTIAVTRNAKTWMRGEADPLVRSLMQVSNVEMKCGRMSFNQLALFLKIMFNPGNYERSAFDFQILTSMCDFLGPATMLKLSERINRSANYGPFRDILNKSAAAFPELYRAYGYNDSRRIYHLRKSLITFRNLMNSVNNFIIIFELAFFEHIMLDIVREISLNALALKLYEPYDLLFVFEFLHKKFARLETLANKNRVLANLMCNAKDRFLPVGFEINPSVHYLWPLIKIRDKNQKTVDPKAKDQAKKE